tara:strand:- start:442 stop:1284 length:843 start_codon:yes stop_codon:yes gene_type:complete
MRHGKVRNVKRRSQKETMVPQFLFYQVLQSIFYTSASVGASSICIVQDSKNAWRNDIYPAYKAIEKDEDLYYQETLEAMDIIAKFFREQTAASVFKVPRTEADDIIGFLAYESDPNIRNVIMSSDEDFIQLMMASNTEIYNPYFKKRGFRKCEDPEFELFVKCIRGDRGDNIRSAFPRVRLDRLKKAWDDDYELQNLMEEKLKDGSKVGDMFEFNSQLIDLDRQPEHIKNVIEREVINYKPSKYNELDAISYLGKNGLSEMRDVINNQNRLLSTKCKFFV